MQKWYVVATVVVLGLLLYWALTPSQSVPEVRNNTIVWLGDSIGSGYGAREGNSPPDYLSRQLGLSVINLSTSGDTTADGVAKIDVVIAQDPGLVIIQLSGNDALQKVSQEKTEANLRTMIEAFQANQSAILMIGIRSGPFGDQYGDMFEDLAAEYQILYLPDALKGLFGRPQYMADPIHPNDAGSEILADRVFNIIGPIY